MIKVGLTGGIGSGKTTVTGIFEKLGAPVFYADNVAKEIMVSDKDVRASIKLLLGEDSFTGDILNREYLAGKVFKNAVLLGKLNAIVHPAVYKRFLNWADDFLNKEYIIHEAAVLLESGAKKYFDYIILVTAPEAQRIERVMRRDGASEEQVRERMRHQYTEEEKEVLSDFMINNDNSTLIIPQILNLHKKLISLNMN